MVLSEEPAVLVDVKHEPHWSERAETTNWRKVDFSATREKRVLTNAMYSEIQESMCLESPPTFLIYLKWFCL